MKKAYIKDITFYVPEKILTNDDLSKVMDTSDEWISTRTGIKQRHVVGESGEGPVDLAVKASEKLLSKTNMLKEKIDFVIFATSTSERYIPGSGSLFQSKMGLKNIGVLDIRQGCAGFVYAISVANQFIQTECYKNILVIGAEVHSTQLNFDNDGRNVAVLFGDGATAALLTVSENEIAMRGSTSDIISIFLQLANAERLQSNEMVIHSIDADSLIFAVKLSN